MAYSRQLGASVVHAELRCQRILRRSQASMRSQHRNGRSHTGRRSPSPVLSAHRPFPDTQETCRTISLLMTADFCHRTSCCPHGHSESVPYVLGARYVSSAAMMSASRISTDSDSQKDMSSVSASVWAMQTKHLPQSHVTSGRCVSYIKSYYFNIQSAMADASNFSLEYD